jgi:hypothetical protein
MLAMAAVLLIAGCSDSTAPLGVDIPPPDTSLDPAALVAPTLIWGCDGWVGAPLTGNNILVDVSFVRRDIDDPDDHPYATHLNAVARHGGQVVYKFHFPVARVWISPADIPALGRESVVNGIFRVNDARRHDWIVGAGFRLPYSYIDGAVRYAQLGGRVDFKWSSTNGIAGLLPDASATALRKSIGVEYVESMAGVWCLA